MRFQEPTAKNQQLIQIHQPLFRFLTSTIIDIIKELSKIPMTTQLTLEPLETHPLMKLIPRLFQNFHFAQVLRENKKVLTARQDHSALELKLKS